MSDEVAIALIGLLSSIVTGISAAVTVLARRVNQNTVVLTAFSAKVDALIKAVAEDLAK
jgi:hypothetical protein